MRTEFPPVIDNSPYYFRIKAIPSSNKTEFVETLVGEEITYKIRLQAQPEKGKANKELIAFLSKEFKIHKNKITIISGQTEQVKLVKISC